MKIPKSAYMKAIKKADRECDFEVSRGFQAKDRPHKNKKKYNRKDIKAQSSKQGGWAYFFAHKSHLNGYPQFHHQPVKFFSTNINKKAAFP